MKKIIFLPVVLFYAMAFSQPAGIPPGKLLVLNAYLTELVGVVSNQFRTVSAESVDWSHADSPAESNPSDIVNPAWNRFAVSMFPFRARIDEYKGPSGSGWILTCEATPGTDRSNKFVAIVATGPQSHKSSAWFQSHGL